MINTVIINPYKQDREKIASLLSLEEDIKVLALGKDGYDAIKLIGNLKPDIAILDNNLDFIVGEEIPPLLKARSPLTAVVILIGRISDYQLFKAASNEVSGFIYKETDIETLPGVLKCVSGGGCFISPGIAGRILHLFSTINRKNTLISGFFTNAPPVKKPENERFFGKDNPAISLSKMELRILSYIGEGLSSDEIAENVNLAVGTVRNYVSSIMHKTGLRNRSQIARYAFSCGLASLNHAF